MDKPRVERRGKNRIGAGKGGKNKKKKSGVVLKKGGFEIVANEGGTVRWDFTIG